MSESLGEAELIADIGSYTQDPLGFVLFVFPWGDLGCAPLKDARGPRRWQREILSEIGARLRAGGVTAEQAVQIAISSGHGIGKSALVAWVVLWALSTFEDSRLVVTANTEQQLRGKTWPELAKWYHLALNRHWFKFTATSLHSVDPSHEKTWRADMVPWSEHRSESFAGLHNEGKRIVVIFDEASAIPNAIWEVTEGALTDENTEIVWLAFGNPTRNSGRFRECFGKLAHRWSHKQIDAREVDGTSKAQIAKWIEDYGEDSDFVRVRVKGEFPRAGTMQFVPSDVVLRAATEQDVTSDGQLVMAVDVARFGDDESVIAFRQGRNARIIPWEHNRGLDTMQLAARVAAHASVRRPGAIFVDETGVGAGVVDRLRQLGYPVFGINNGSKPDSTSVDGELVSSKGAECWANMRHWLRTGGRIPNDPDLKSQLESREYGYNVHNQIVLERKDDMKKRGLASPDRADGLALTFAYPLAIGDEHQGGRGEYKSEYDPLNRNE